MSLSESGEKAQFIEKKNSEEHSQEHHSHKHSGEQSSEHSAGSNVEEGITWDPSAKPTKGILKKPGDSGPKSDTHINIKSDDSEEHDAEKKKKNKAMPVEGRQGIIQPGIKKGSIEKKTPVKQDDENKVETKKKTEESNEGDEKKKENCVIS